MCINYRLFLPGLFCQINDYDYEDIVHVLLKITKIDMYINSA